MLFLQFFDLLDKLLRFFKTPVDAGVAHVGNLVERPERFHDSLANCHRGNFAIVLITDLLDHLIGDLLDLLRADGAFTTSDFEAVQEFIAGEGFTTVIALNDSDRFIFDLFVSGKTMSTTQAFAAAADGLPFARGARIDDFIFLATTLTATHTFRCGMILLHYYILWSQPIFRKTFSQN